MLNGRWRFWAAAAAGVLLLEAALRISHPPISKPLEPHYEQFLLENAGDFFRSEIGSNGQWLVQTPSAYQTISGQRIAALLPSDARRVVFFGEDSADNLAMLTRDLAAPPAGQRLEVISMAVGGSSLELARRRLDELSRLKPDAVIVQFGHNLFLRHRFFHPRLYRLRGRARRSRLLDVLLGPEPRRRFPEYFSGPKERLAAYSQFLEEMGARLRVPVLALTSTSNMMAPPLSDALDAGDPEYVRTLVLHDAGRGDEALRRLEALVTMRPTALWQFTLGDWHLQRGNPAQARLHLLAARNRDRGRRLAHTSVNKLLRAAAARQGWILLDAERLVEAAAPNGIAGFESFIDDQHLNETALDALARKTLELLGEKIMPGLGAKPGVPEKHSFRYALENTSIGTDASALPTVTQLALAERPSLTVMREALDAADPQLSAGLRLAFAEAAWRRGDRPTALRLNEEASRLKTPWEREAALQRGRFLLRLRRCQAARAAFASAAAGSAGVKELSFLQALDDERVCPPTSAVARP